MSRYGKTVDLALLACPGRISKSPDTQSNPQLERCPHVCRIQAAVERVFSIHASGLCCFTVIKIFHSSK